MKIFKINIPMNKFRPTKYFFLIVGTCIYLDMLNTNSIMKS